MQRNEDVEHGLCLKVQALCTLAVEIHPEQAATY